MLISDTEYRIGQPALEAFIIHELFEQFVVVLHDRGHYPLQCLVMLDAGVLSVRILLRILESSVRGYPRRNRLGNQLPHAVDIVPQDIAEKVVESPDDVREPIQLGIALVAAGTGRHRFDHGFLVRQHDALHCPFLDPVTVHVDGVENALGQVLFLRGRELSDQEVQEDRTLFPSGVCVGQHAG